MMIRIYMYQHFSTSVWAVDSEISVKGNTDTNDFYAYFHLLL